MSVTYDEGVFEELVNLSAYLAEHNENIAHSFLDACNDTFQLLAENRYLGSPGKFENPELINVRMWRVKNFEKYFVFLCSDRQRREDPSHFPQRAGLQSRV